MGNKGGRYESYHVSAINEPSSDEILPYRYQIEYKYKGKRLWEPLKLVNEELLIYHLFMFKKQCPRGKITFDEGMSHLELKVRTYDPNRGIETIPSVYEG